MTSNMLAAERAVRTTPLSIAPPLSATLRHIHRRWMDETSEWLSPTLVPDADFWNGWSAVRFLNDQFDRQYRRTCALIGAILPLLPPTDAFILRARTVVLERTRRALDHFGRRQGMTKVVAALTYRFLKLLRTWFAEIERVTAELTLHEPWPDGFRALVRIRPLPQTAVKAVSSGHRPGEG
jgi:hypothetical protein